MQPILTAAQTQALDRDTEVRGVPVADLMERAGVAVARAVLALAGGGYGRRAVVVAGKGNNGGDGLVAARHLARSGMRVAVHMLTESPLSALRQPALANFHRLLDAGVSWEPLSAQRLSRDLHRADVAVDAIFGTGFRGVPRPPYEDAIRAFHDLPPRCRVVSVDIPSGVEGDTGIHHGPVVEADVTVTFGALKPGHVFYPGSVYSGRVEVADIGFPAELLTQDELVLVEEEDVRGWLPLRDPAGDKRRSGTVLVVAGSRRMTGAPALVARGAYRAGAGLVSVAVPESILPIVQAGILEATFLPLLEGPSGSLSLAAWDAISERVGSFDALAVGPGLSTEEETPELVRRLIRECPVPVVLDADGLNAFAGRSGELSGRASQAVMTPHAREFARVFGMPPEEVVDDPVGLARKGAAETGAVVLLKGLRTVVALPEGQVRVNPTGTPVLATAGTGDVLTGVLAALLARGSSPADAASAAAFVHGLAGRIAGERLGEGTMASDVAAAIPEAVRRVSEEEEEPA